MENESGKVFTPLNSGAEKLQSFFMEHLNRLYCAKAHIIERLPDIADAECFRSIKGTINETIARAEVQVYKMDQIYSLFKTQYSFDTVSNLVNFLEKSFTNFQWNMTDPDLGLIMILSYLSFIECLEGASVQILKMLAIKLQNEKLSFLLREDFVNVDSTLASQLTNMYTETAHY